ncbi:sh3 domain-binding protein 5-like protein [Lasius niger]|uniref:Sh3 domain-binding protein 5-like protein n=1 Tax=Lasius niger TaxID=67767 RepID=A0A0J7KTA1_LASNI|nr:sh3 domain-binding protein 5-like protein [Lasius niger]
MDIVENSVDALDPRIQIELENLNNATDDINKLETELDEAHTAFRQLLSDTTRRLKEISDKLGTSCIEKARCYYEALEMARQAQVQCQQQAQLFQRASEIHAAAKETVTLAEARFMSHQHEWNFDQAWQDMLNHATMKVMDAENQKAECGREHHRRAMLFHDAEKKLLQLEEKHRRAIIKARPYFEVKAQCDQMLATQKERVEYLQQTVKEVKRNYATSLRTLENISNQIHQQRRDYDIVANGPREPGVGAELIGSDTCQKYENEFNSCKISPIKYNQIENNEKPHNIKKFCSTKENAEHIDKRSVDGSESRFTQWELELQASMEKLNRLSVGNSLLVRKRDAQSSSDLRNTVDAGVNRKAQSSWNINDYSNNFNIDATSEEQKRNKCSNTNDSLVNTSHVQLTNLSTMTVSLKFLPAEPTLSKGRCPPDPENRSATFPDISQHLMNSQNDITRSSSNILQKSTSYSANSSPVKLKNRLISSAKSSDSENVKRFAEGSTPKQFVNKTPSIKELPLLSLIGPTSALSMLKGKSCSMIDLDDKQNLKMLLDNSRLGNIQAISVERLANVRHKLVNNYPEIKKTDDIKK